MFKWPLIFGHVTATSDSSNETHPHVEGMSWANHVCACVKDGRRREVLGGERLGGGHISVLDGLGLRSAVGLHGPTP